MLNKIESSNNRKCPKFLLPAASCNCHDIESFVQLSAALFIRLLRLDISVKDAGRSSSSLLATLWPGRQKKDLIGDLCPFFRRLLQILPRAQRFIGPNCPHNFIYFQIFGIEFSNFQLFFKTKNYFSYFNFNYFLNFNFFLNWF